MRIYTLNHKNKSHICQKRLSVPVEMEFVRKIRSYDYLQEDKMMLIVFCHLFVNNEDDYIGWHNLKFLYDEKWMSSCAHSGLLCGCHTLMENKLVENAYKDGFASKYFKLTDKAKRELLGELHLKSIGDGNNTGGIINTGR